MPKKKKKKLKWKELFEFISPILIDPKLDSIKIGISKRFLIFQMLDKLTKKIEDNPHLNFIGFIKSYKILGRILYGTFHEFYRDRNKPYFKGFFINRKLYLEVKKDFEWLHEKYGNKIKNIKVTITKRGVIVYDNYQKNNFNVLLLTIHSGTWVRKDIEKKMVMTKSERLAEEDIDSHKIYADLIIQKAGIWIDNKMSRFACDFNRSPINCIYKNDSEKMTRKNLWKENITKAQRNWLMQSYSEFYLTLSGLINTYRFNIIFDGHTMKNLKGRPAISFGTKYIPRFYMPIVRCMQRKIMKLEYSPIALNKPYEGGFILRWLNDKFPDVFICSMEINKRLYMTKDRRRTIKKRITALSKNISYIFDIEEETEESKA